MPGEIERITQNRIVKLFQKKEGLNYSYLGDWEEREGNSNIEVELLTKYLKRQGYSPAHISKAIFELQSVATNFNDSLYTTNKEVYKKLRFGVQVKVNAGDNYETVKLFNWTDPLDNDFAIAEEVTYKGNKTKRPDIVIYVNGIALAVLELKRGIIDIGEGIRQNITNQQDRFIQPFFSTVQILFAGNDSEGLRYGTISTEEKWYLGWKEDVDNTSQLMLDKYLQKICDKERFMELLYDFVLFDGGIKKLPRVHQYFGVKEAEKFVKRYEGGIIWHTQGSGKSLTMVYLAKWILENNPNARIAILTDRTELDKQIEDVFTDAGESIYRTSSGRDLMTQLSQEKPRLLCSLVHKFGNKDTKNFDKFIAELAENPFPVAGELFVFVDECHRTQSGKLHRTMKAMLPNAVFIGFTGTPLLKKDKQTSLEVFGKYIHTYKFNEGVEDGVILDLMYEPRDIDQRLTSESKVDEWFKAKTKGLNEFQTSELKKKWGTMQNVLSSRSRMEKIVADITFDFSTKRLLTSTRSNAILVANSIYEACEYYKLFQKTEFKGKCAVITSYNPHHGDVTTEDTGANTETKKEAIYNLYEEILKDVETLPNKTKTESYEDWAKLKFRKEPANMKLLVVVSKLLTGFDAPSCAYIYLDKSMQDHGLFQAICRTNRVNGEEKDYGYIVDYRNLFDSVGAAISVYTSELDMDDFDSKDISVMLEDRLTVGKKRLDDSIEALALLCEPVKPPKGTLQYIHYFCGNPEKEEDLKETAPQRTVLYKNIVAFIRAYANIADEMTEAGYSVKEAADIHKELDFYLKLREEIKKASGETLDFKTYEADMRHLIDTYIQAEDPENISPFGDMSLLEIITNSGIGEAIGSLPKGIKGDKGAIAETIENNVRKKIISDQLIDPAFFEKMSKLLAELIKERKANAVSYEEYLKRIADLAKQVNEGKNPDTPPKMDTSGKRALYNNLNENEELVIKMDVALKTQSPADWRGIKAKENIVKKNIYDVLTKEEENFEAAEPIYKYGIEAEVVRIFEIVKNQPEY
ncbi:type I restriction endonuclease subunit R [Algoriphagus machipongonensis]|uniref:Type I restriction enzyme endonuclease subunit n=1 Tax=Algoriphagus machipongonensis TaxID=388413 RepID=A3HT81_9BACT|nr:HsdR family type I site-specific deoxyribonuclease [Algoriphagus machipongonensis]EAZ83049.1 type I restriction-modification system, R subunit [Algoriphagus machipongonensis]